jgi:RNA polymerase sigma-70 factor (ECF subfamily)
MVTNVGQLTRAAFHSYRDVQAITQPSKRLSIPQDSFTSLRAVEAADATFALVRLGDRAAFSSFYDATVKRVYSVIRRCLIDPAISEEVTQDVYLEVWQNAARYDSGKGSAVSWILTIAHRRAIDRVRATQSSRDRDLKIGIRDLPRDYDNVAEEVEISTEFARAKRAIACITELQREVVQLAYFDGLSQTEIAELLRVNVSTVKTRLRDGLIRLRSEMLKTA